MSAVTAKQSRVTTLELFFDLVFVFSVTQVSELLIHAHEPAHYARAFMVLGITWWMYGGFAWLTNNISTSNTFNRSLVLCAMAAFLVMALSTPHAFDRDALPFGIAYLCINLIHTILFSRANNASAKAIWRIAPLNVTVALVIVAAAFFPEHINWIIWLVAILALFIVPFSAAGGFEVEPEHFVERHGLVILIALGESVVSIGLGAINEKVTVELIASAVLTLALIAAMWWSYFERDEKAAEHGLTRATGPKRSRMALFAFGYAKLVMIGGIVTSAAGIKLAIESMHEEIHAVVPGMLAAGVGLFFFGNTLFRAFTGIRGIGLRLSVAILCAATFPVGLFAGVIVHIATLFVLLTAMLIFETVRARKAEVRGPKAAA